MSILDEASGIVTEYDKMVVLTAIANALEQSPDGDWVFLLTNGPSAEADGIFIDSNVDPMEGMMIAEVFKHVTLSRLWNPVDEEIDDSDESEVE